MPAPRPAAGSAAPRQDGESKAAASVKATRAEAVAEGRADVAAGHVYSAEAVKHWMERWDTLEESQRPEAGWGNETVRRP